MSQKGEKTWPEGNSRLIMETVRNRLMIAVFLFIGAFFLLGARMVGLGFSPSEQLSDQWARGLPVYVAARADVVDRHGVVLATNLETSSLYADPGKVQNPETAIKKLATVIPELAYAKLLSKLKSDKRFVWVRRKLTPQQKVRINALGLPGFFFQTEEERVYPHGALFSHAVGYVDVDGKGLGGIEHYFDIQLGTPISAGDKLQLTLDTRVQHALRDEIERALQTYEAKAASGIVLNVNTGEVLAMVSLPDFDPNLPASASNDQKFNRASQGVYELGSLFKTLTVAMGLDSGAITLTDRYDVTKPLKISRFLIRDDHPKNRILTVPEIFIFSSNIGAAQMAMDIGTDTQQEYFGKLGLFTAPFIEITEVGRPIYPSYWRDINTMTAGYGHGIAISPLQMASAIAATVNGGHLIPATLIKQDANLRGQGIPVFSEEVSAKMRTLMRLAVTEGTGSKADVPGYLVGGKTGTAEKPGEGGYLKNATMSSFVGVFPMNKPEFLVLIVLDEPVGQKKTFNFSGGGWVAAPAVGRVITRIAPLLGVKPITEEVRGYQEIAYLISDTR